MILILAITGILFANIAGAIEGKVDAQQENPEHNYSALFRVLAYGIYSSAIVFLLAKDVWIDTYVLAAGYTGHLLVWHGNALDLAHNRETGKHWLYVGKTAKTDQWNREIEGAKAFRLFTKIALILISGLICYHIMTNYSLA